MLFMSDIHGHLAALNAVLEDAKKHDVTEFYVAGDLVFGGEDSLNVWRRLMELKAKLIRGTSDIALASLNVASLTGKDPARIALLEHTRKSLGEIIVKNIGRLPDEHRGPLVDGSEFLMVHGSPKDPMTEITVDMDDSEVIALLDDDPADIVLCGSSHVPFQRDVEGVRLIGLGSVGQAPEGRFAHYTVLTSTLSGTIVEQASVEY